MVPSAHDALESLHPAVRRWFCRAYGQPSPPQQQGWPAVAGGRNVLLLAPTGSGKTLAAFLQCLSELYRRWDGGDPLDDGIRVLYISPLKALNNDIFKNLELPLNGIVQEAAGQGGTLPRLTVGVRTGDTSSSERRAMARRPPHILITTPESLLLMLASSGRNMLRHVQYVIVDEIHALFATKRGVHLALSLEHLQAINPHPFQRIGLSATQRPLDEVAAFLGGGAVDPDGVWRPRAVQILDTGQRKELDLRIALPVEDLRSLPERTIWPRVYEQLLQLVQQHQSTLVFVNNRRLAERLTAQLNDLAGSTMARTHHGSLAREQRLEVEEQLKAGRLKCIVATSSLELGIDVGAIDLVVQVESPKGVARGLQRVGRAGHLVGMPSKGRIIPKTQSDLLECAALAHEMRSGLVEKSHAPENCLDVLAQQVVAMVCVDGRGAGELFGLVRGAYPYRRLPRASFDAVLHMLAGGYESSDFLELQPRLFWDRVNDKVRASDRGKRLVYTSSGTIPDRGYFGVYLTGTHVRLGELDEEFVAERRLGERFLLGTSSWQIDEIRQDRVMVSPSGRGEAQVPFWKAESSGRGYELGRRIGSFMDEVSTRLESDDFDEWAQGECLLDAAAARNLRAYLRSQTLATGAVPTHRCIVIEEYRDELGGWRVILHSPFGERVHNPLAMLLREQILQRDGVEVEVMQDDNGILFHGPGAEAPPQIDLDALDPGKLVEDLTGLVRGSRQFALLFRHNAARALLLPRGPYGHKRTPLWLSRLRASDLLQVATAYPDFPIVIETMRECLQDVFDVEGLRQFLTSVRNGSIAVHQCRHARPSPFSHALQFSFYGTYMYVLDMPKGERRFRALGLNRDALRQLMGTQEMRGLLDRAEIDAASLEARGLDSAHVPRNADEMHAWLLRYGEWRVTPDGETLPSPFESQVSGLADELLAAGRAALIELGLGQADVRAWVAAEEVPLFKAAWPVNCRVLKPEGLDGTSLPDRSEALARLVRRYVHAHGPFTMAALSAHFGMDRSALGAELAALEAAGVVQRGEFSPGVRDVEWCDVTILQRIHRRSLSRARREIRPRGAAEFCAHLARWQRVAAPVQGGGAVADALERMSGCWMPVTAWGGGVLPARVPFYNNSMLDQLVGSGQYSWTARTVAGDLHLAFWAPGSQAWPAAMSGMAGTNDPNADAVRGALTSHGALFLQQIVQVTGLSLLPALDALELLVASGEVTNDTLGPARFFAGRKPEHRTRVIGSAVLAQMGRWSLTGRGEPAGAELVAERLIQRYGIITRDLVSGEGFSWGELSPVYDRWEAIGKVRRGYFVTGLAGLQFALPGAVDSLRLETGDGLPEFWTLLWRDPANPFSSALALENRGETGIQPDLVVMRRGVPVLLAGGKKLRIASLAPLEGDALSAAIQSLAALAVHWRGPEGRLTVVEYDGRPVQDTPAAPALERAGFERGYRLMVRWSAV